MGGSLGLRDPGQDAAGARFVLALRIELPAGSHHADERGEPAAPQPQATTPR